MFQYTVRRVLLIIPTILILATIVFGIMRVLPGDVAMMILGTEDSIQEIAPESLESLRKRLGLLDPLHIQYVKWVYNAFRGDFGNSLYSGKSVMDDILHRLPITFEITVLALAIGVLAGVPIGIISAVKQNTFIDYWLRFWSVFFLAAPTFWIGILVILAGAIWFNYIPPLGYHSLIEEPMENLTQIMWPSIILASHGMAIMARMTRSTMLEVLREDYIRTARAKGLAGRVVLVRHALKNALIPVITLAGLTFAGLMGGTVLLEYIFGVPGMGSLFIQAILIQDYTMVQGVIVVFAAIFMAVNLIIDLLYGWLDPVLAIAR